MNREQLEHILRAASQIADDPNVVIGSQSILGAIPEDRLPREATASMEVDVAFFDDPDNRKSDQVDGAIGELSPFHEMNGYYAQGSLHCDAARRVARSLGAGGVAKYAARTGLRARAARLRGLQTGSRPGERPRLRQRADPDRADRPGNSRSPHRNLEVDPRVMNRLKRWIGMYTSTE